MIALPGREHCRPSGSGDDRRWLLRDYASGWAPGNYIVPDGSRAYCMDSSADWPSGASVVGALAMATGEGLSPVVLQKFNYALSTWGQTGDATQAAAVNAYVYAYTSTWAHFNGQGYSSGMHYINGNAAVQGAFNYIWSTTEANAALFRTRPPRTAR